VTQPALRLLHITDTHLHADRAVRLRGVETHRTLTRVIDQAAADRRPAQAVLATGDLSQDETRESYEHFRELVARLGLPVWCVPGNHDAPGHMDAVLSHAPFSIGGVKASGNWCVVLLDSYLAGDHGGRLASAELERLDAVLREHRGQHVLIAVHHHPLPLRSRWLDDLGLYNGADLLAIVARSPQVRCVLAGHVHQASDIVRDGVRFLTTPSTCFQFLPESDAFAIDTRPPGFRWLDLMPDGSIVTEVSWVSPG
jgi:Icc protein